MPGRYSLTFRSTPTQIWSEVFLYGVTGIVNPALVLLNTITRHTILLIMLTSHTIGL
jgi:hypothetical protein